MARATSRRNPWLPVLWVLSVVVLAAGVGAFWYSQVLISGPITTPQEYYILPAVLSALAPWLLATGLAALVGTVFLHAVRWGRS